MKRYIVNVTSSGEEKGFVSDRARFCATLIIPSSALMVGIIGIDDYFTPRGYQIDMPMQPCTPVLSDTLSYYI